jgi:hypothetical protein
MIINIGQGNYVKDAGDTAGMRMVVHTGTRMPFPEDEGITISPGHSTSIGLQKVELLYSIYYTAGSLLVGYFLRVAKSNMLQMQSLHSI